MKEEVVKRRHAISMRYCEEKEWDFNNLSLEQILEIRELKDWKEATIGLTE